MRPKFALPLVCLAAIAVLAIASVALASPQTDFAETEIALANQTAPVKAPKITFKLDPSLGAQGYRIARTTDGFCVFGGDATGGMYGGLDVAEAVRHGTLDRLPATIRQPHIVNRGIKFNIPLDLRTPSYSDSGDASQANIPVMWEEDFWHTLLDEMARHRYNVLSLWSLHPFPSLVKVPEFPDIALDDVWRTRVKFSEKTDDLGTDMVTPAMLADHEVVKRISIDQKIAFWRRVMQYAHDRGIGVYVFTWNVFTFGTDGKHGITDGMDNATTIAYFRASVRELVKTYPLLAGLGITAGENMPSGRDAEAKERWLWSTYGEGVRDALREDPKRVVRMIHRYHWTSLKTVLAEWKDYPGPFDLSYKYSVAHMYSIVNPPFIKPALAGLPAGYKTWLTVRNDDLYTFRFGDPDYARDYVLHMPPADRNAGFYMGPDGFCWGRDFLDRTPASGPRPLVLQKQWYSFMLWGRLSYDPTIPNAVFSRELGARFPSTDATSLYRALHSASQVMPMITRFFWGDIDVKWFPEGCLSKPTRSGFYTVRHFIEGESMPGANVLDIRDWRDRLNQRQPMRDTTPLQIAESLDGAAAAVFGELSALRAHPAADRELAATIDDTEALAWLGRYYASKIRGACALALFDLSADPTEQTAAVRELERALAHWKSYARVRDGRYLPALYNRVGYVDITALTTKVAADITLAQQWKPGTVTRKAVKPAAPRNRLTNDTQP